MSKDHKQDSYPDQVVSTTLKIVLFVLLVYILGQYTGYIWAIVINLLGLAGSRRR